MTEAASLGDAAPPWDARNLPEMIDRAAACYGDRPAFFTRDREGMFRCLSYRELRDRAIALATALIELGLAPRERVALLSDNRLEWMVANLAIQYCGAIDVPRGSEVTLPELKHIVPHSDARFAFVENAAMLSMLERAELRGSLRIVLLEGAAPGCMEVAALLARGSELRAAGDRAVEARADAIDGEDLFTLIYTSGTTGTPKGVMLTQANILSQVRNIPLTVGTEDRVLSVLPIWHSYERMFEMVCLSRGAATYYGKVRTLAEDFRLVKPTFMASAPRLWESVHARLEHRIRAGGALERALFRAAHFVSRQWRGSLDFLLGRSEDQKGRGPLESLLRGAGHLVRMLVFVAPGLCLDALVLRKLRMVAGGALRGTISGGGALPRHIDEFLNYAGIPLLEGYGLTETCPVVAFRTWTKPVIGTVGPLYPNTEVRIVDLNDGRVLYPDRGARGNGRGLRGEIQVRGPQVMRGYYKDPEGTARVLVDGWFRTGDIGLMTWNDCLKIVGRSKDTIVLRSGENVEPGPIEAALLHSELIAQCMVVGQDQKHLGLLVVPGPDADRRAIEDEVARIISPAAGWKSFERIVGIELLPKPFEVGDELTATYKIRRHHVAEKYAVLIARLFAGGERG